MIESDCPIWLVPSSSSHTLIASNRLRMIVIFVLLSYFRGFAWHHRISWLLFIIRLPVTTLPLFIVSCRCHIEIYPNNCRISSTIYFSSFDAFSDDLDMPLVSKTHWINKFVPIFLFRNSIWYFITTHIAAS